MKNSEYLLKVWKKNLDKFKFALETDTFIEDVKSIRNFWNLPIIINDVGDPQIKFSKALKIFFSRNLLVKAAFLLKNDFPNLFPHLDRRKISVLILAINSVAELAQEITQETEETQVRRVFNTQELDFFFPSSAYLIGRSMALSYCARRSQPKDIDLPPESVAKIARILKSRLSPEDLGEALEFMGFVKIASVFLYGGFLQNIWQLASNLGFGGEWFLPLMNYLMVDLDIVAVGYVPPVNVLIQRYPNGEFVLKDTISTKKRDFEVAYALMHWLGARAKAHNYPRKNQARDLEISRLSERKKYDREKLKQIADKDERDNLEGFLRNDDAIAIKLFNSDPWNTNKTNREINVIRQARCRTKKLKERSYNRFSVKNFPQ